MGQASRVSHGTKHSITAPAKVARMRPLTGNTDMQPCKPCSTDMMEGGGRDCNAKEGGDGKKVGGG